MKLHLKRDVTSEDVCFAVFDESGVLKYRALSVVTKVTKKTNLLLCNNSGETVAKIRRLPIVGTYTFVLRVKKSHITALSMRRVLPHQTASSTATPFASVLTGTSVSASTAST